VGAPWLGKWEIVLVEFTEFEPLEADRLHNVSQLLSHAAAQVPNHPAVAVPGRGDRQMPSATPPGWKAISYAQLDELATAIARGLLDSGIPAGTRLALMVRPGIEFVGLVFGLMRAGMVQVLIDPGMGRQNMVNCLQECDPAGFVGIPLAQVMRLVFRRRFPNAKFNVTVGRKWGWGGSSYRQILARGRQSTRPVNQTLATEQAAIIFTTGSTGPPKGVFYSHQMFIQQATQIRDFYQIRPGGVDLSGFPLFALFNIGMGVTTVIPKMDPTRPAEVDPRNIIQAVEQWGANQSFGSPALWNTVSRYGEKNKVRLPSLQKVFSAGAPVPPHVLRRVQQMIGDQGEVYTPYGATEALPIASNSATEILSQTAERSAGGAGTCVGRRFPGIQWQVVAISDQPVATLSPDWEVPSGEIGELLVSGPVVSPRYVTRLEANALHKVVDPRTQAIWHRTGDLGYLDPQGRFWFCGRKGHRVVTRRGTLFTIPVEAIINTHAAVYRSALVGVGELGQQVPVLIAEPWPEHWTANPEQQERLLQELRSLAQQDPRTQQLEHYFLMKQLPVDIRHNSKIFREKLAVWAAGQLGSQEAACERS
jgi:acyl-CoA synthetase (AMP-forming)/AMP-acid ligase II